MRWITISDIEDMKRKGYTDAEFVGLLERSLHLDVDNLLAVGDEFITSILLATGEVLLQSQHVLKLYYMCFTHQNAIIHLPVRGLARLLLGLLTTSCQKHRSSRAK